MVRLSKVSRIRLISRKRPKIKTGPKGCCGCSCKPKIRMHENAITGDLAVSVFVPKMKSQAK